MAERAPNTADLTPELLEQAADWMMRLASGRVSDAERAACERWRQRSEAHAHAWRLAQSVTGQFGGLPPALAMPVLNRPAAPRRRALVKLMAALAVAPGVWAALRLREQLQWGADYRSATGERRVIALADGSELLLNSDSAVDVAFDARQRLLRLRRGEVQVRTVPDAAGRPFLVATEQGEMRALGTRFLVRALAAGDNGPARTRLTVLEHAVRISLRGDATPSELTLVADQQVSFSADEISAPQAADTSADAWIHGMLVADRLRLDRFIEELSRYHSGLIRCTPQIAGIPVSGSFPIDTPERALALLAATYPVRVDERFGGLWLTVAAR